MHAKKFKVGILRGKPPLLGDLTKTPPQKAIPISESAQRVKEKLGETVGKVAFVALNGDQSKVDKNNISISLLPSKVKIIQDHMPGSKRIAHTGAVDGLSRAKRVNDAFGKQITINAQDAYKRQGKQLGTMTKKRPDNVVKETLNRGAVMSRQRTDYDWMVSPILITVAGGLIFYYIYK